MFFELVEDRNKSNNYVMFKYYFVHLLNGVFNDHLDKINNTYSEGLTILSHVLKAYEQRKKHHPDPEELKNYIDVIGYLRNNGATAEDEFSKIVLDSMDKNTSVANIVLSYKKEKITEIDPTLPINYTWIGIPTEHNRFAISGHDVAGPIDMVKTIHKQARENDEDLYRKSKNYGKVNFYCINEYINYYKELFERHLSEFNNEGYSAEINVFGVQDYLNDNTNDNTARYSKKIIDYVKNFRADKLLPSLDEVKENNKKISSPEEYYKAISDNIKKSRLFAVFKDAFTLFLLWNSQGYILDTNVIPHRENTLQLAKFSKPASMIMPNCYHLKFGKFYIHNDFYCIFSPEPFNKEIEIFLLGKITVIDISPATIFTGIEDKQLDIGYICGKEIGLCKINFSSHRNAYERKSSSSQNISVNSFYNLPKWAQEVFKPFMNKEYEEEKNEFYKNHFEAIDKNYRKSL